MTLATSERHRESLELTGIAAIPQAVRHFPLTACTAVLTLQLLTVYVTVCDNYSSCKFAQSKLQTTRACKFTCSDVTMHYILQMWDLQNKRFRQRVRVCLSFYLSVWI